MTNPLYPTLLQFWNRSGLMSSADVREPEFKRLYVRKGKKCLLLSKDETLPIQDQYRWVDNLLQIANLEAHRPRHGAFKRLLDKIDRNLGCNIFVENVFNQGFAEALPRLGFVALELPPLSPPCFIKFADVV